MIPVSIPALAPLPPAYLALPTVTGTVDGTLPFTIPEAPVAVQSDNGEPETGEQEAVVPSTVPVEQMLPLVAHFVGLAAAKEAAAQGTAAKEAPAPRPEAPLPASPSTAAPVRPNVRVRVTDAPNVWALPHPEPVARDAGEEAETPALPAGVGPPAPVAKTEAFPYQIARGAAEQQAPGTATPQRLAEEAARPDKHPATEAQSRDLIGLTPEIASTPAAKPTGQAIPMVTVAFDVSASAARPIDPAPVTTPVAQPADYQLDLAHEELWLGQLARDIAAMGEGRGIASFRLLPRALGQLDVNIQPSDNGLAIHMSASSEDARAIVAAAQPKLVEEIRAQGVRVADASVGNGSMGDPKGGRAPEYRPPFIEVALNSSDPAPQRSETRVRAGRYA